MEGAITSRTKAILPVSFSGRCRTTADQRHRGTARVEGDRGRCAELRGDAAREAERGGDGGGRDEFFPAKPLGCYGDGGALFANDQGLAEKLRAIRTHGGLRRHYHPMLGTNGRFDTLQAAVLLAKLPHFPWEVEERGRIGARYSAALAGHCVVPAVAAGNTHVYAQYTIRIPDRDKVAERLKGLGIPTAVYYPKCLHEQPVFAKLGCGPGDMPEAEKASREVLSLPMHPFLSPKAGPG